LPLETAGELNLPGYRWLEIAALRQPSDTPVSAASAPVLVEVDQLNANWTRPETGIERVSLA
jgi:hypothetical protein